MVPALTSEVCSGTELEWTFAVPAQSPFFAGHFPGHPILPGVVALSWLLAAATRLRGSPALTVTLLNVKFQVIIEPGARLTLTLAPKSAGYLLGTIRSGAGIHATALIPVGER